MAIALRGITKKFGDSVALNPISFDIKNQEFIAVLGPSGCGKTTLLRLIGGFLKPGAGTIRCDDKLYSSPDYLLPVENRNLGMVFQSFALWPHLNVKEHILFPLNNKTHRHMTPEEKNALVANVLKTMGLEKLIKRFPGELSGGQKQRVALARAIVAKPSILLLDEPLSALDAELRVQLRQEIQAIHKITGATMIYVTHDQSEALAMADRMIIMKSGNIEQIGTPKEIYLHPQTKFVATFVSKCNIIKGTWQNDDFIVNGTNIIYDGREIAKHFKENGIYPIRPEQFKISRAQAGIGGKIINKQYQGREIHYTIDCNGNLFNVYSSIHEDYDPAARVNLVYCNTSSNLQTYAL